MVRRSAITAAVTGAIAVLLPLFPACTSGDPVIVVSPTTPAASYSAAELQDLEHTVRSYVAAWFGDDPTTVLALRSRRCLAAVPEPSVVERIAEHSAAFPALGIIDYQVQAQDGDALVSIWMTKIEANQHTELDQFFKRWVMEDGRWRWDACPSADRPGGWGPGSIYL